LGTLPGQASIMAGEYYAHPRNAFWQIMGSIFGFDPASSYARRVAALKSARVAVWDLCEAAYRPGSRDTAIAPASVRVNDFSALFAAHPSIEAVLFNGKKPEALFRKHVASASVQRLEFRLLPSTSPAHAGMSFAEKRRRWAAAFR
jgi:hypoxanthine-DNA glycosylase